MRFERRNKAKQTQFVGGQRARMPGCLNREMRNKPNLRSADGVVCGGSGVRFLFVGETLAIAPVIPAQAGIQIASIGA